MAARVNFLDVKRFSGQHVHQDTSGMYVHYARYMSLLVAYEERGRDIERQAEQLAKLLEQLKQENIGDT